MGKLFEVLQATQDPADSETMALLSRIITELPIIPLALVDGVSNLCEVDCAEQ